MARYIDADALLEMLNDKAKTDLEMGLYNHGALTQSFIRFVERRPTADVAPRAEVAREIFEEIEKQIAFFKKYMYANENVKAIVGVLEELKKKYTGGD